MGDLTPRGFPVGHNNSKIRRKRLDILNMQTAIEQKEVEILERQEEIAKMQERLDQFSNELIVLEEQFGKKDE